MMPPPKQGATKGAASNRRAWQEYMKQVKRQTRPVRAFNAPRFNPGALDAHQAPAVEDQAEAPTPVVQLAGRMDAHLPTMMEGNAKKATEADRASLLDRGSRYRT